MSRESRKVDKKHLTLLVEDYWGRLSPIQQSTSNADTLLGDAFEPLVDLNPQGGTVPGVAQRWEISEDDRIYRFYLRSGVRFSDGTFLTPEIYRQSLLRSVVSVDRDSHNPNSLDVLYRLKGFSLESAERGEVPGLRVEADGALVFEFSSPFRTALAELTGTRYSAWKKDEHSGSFLGTGPYRIVQHVENEKVEYEPNPFSWRPAVYQHVTVLRAPNGYLDLCTGKGQVYLGRSLPVWLNDPICQRAKIEFQGGAIEGHSLVAVNALPGKLFSDPNLRLAIQYFVSKLVNEIYPQRIDPRIVELDSQFFPPLWPGRISDDEVKQLLGRGEPYLKDLVEKSRKRPIRLLCATERFEGVQKGLEELGVHFARPFQVDEVQTVVEAMYGKHDYDLNVHGASVVGSDPDGLYHLLGKTGALASPATARPGVSIAMERARSVPHGADLNPYYSEVARKIFEEVPEIHTAYYRGGTFFDASRVKAEDHGMNSDRFRFDGFVFK